MARLAEDLAEFVGRGADTFAGFKAQIRPEWLEQALAARTVTKSAKLRNRKLPLEHVLWLVVGMAFLRNRSIEEVVTQLELVLGEEGELRRVSPSAVAQARVRLGAGPVETLFELTANAWSDEHLSSHRWRGMSVWAMDGTCFNVPDTVENHAAFGRPSNDRAWGAFPQVRAVALLDVRNRLLRGFCVGGFDEGELTLMTRFWEQVPDQSVTIVDAGLISWAAFLRLQGSGKRKHWVVRAKKNTSAKVVERLGEGDELVDIQLNATTRKLLPGAPLATRVRRITAERRGFRPLVVYTSLLDADEFPAKDVANLYRERWEIELAYDEVKTHLLDKHRVLRSKRPEGVLQELYGIALTYNLVRRAMAHAAHRARLRPTQLSFIQSVDPVCGFLYDSWYTSPGALPARVEHLLERLTANVLPDRRGRSLRREVKLVRRRYPTKRTRKPAPGADESPK